MRIRTICATALVTLALPASGSIARAQGWQGNPNQSYPPGYGYPAPYAYQGYAPYAMPPGYGPNPPATPYYPNGYPAAQPGYYPYGYPPAAAMMPMQPGPQMLPGAPVPSANVPGVTAPGSTVPGATTTPGAPTQEKIGPPKGSETPESSGPPMGTVPCDYGDPGEPIVTFTGQTNPGYLPPLRRAVPERLGGDRFWFSADYVAAFVRPERFATPLVTTGSAQDAHPAGVGQRGTAILFGGDNADFRMQSGFRIGTGFYIGDGQCWALDFSGTYLFPNYVRFKAASDSTGNPIIARPVFDVVNNFERAFVDAFPGAVVGGASVDMKSQFFGTEANIVYFCRPSEQCRIDALFGFRYMRLYETLAVTDVLRPLRNNNIQFQGAFINTTNTLIDGDTFNTTDDFYGLQFGGRFKYEWERFYIGAFGKIGLGATSQEVKVAGATTLVTPQGMRTTPGGILALPSNMGTHTRTEFGVVPETGLELGVRLTPHLRFTAGYSFLAWTQVVRPGDQLNRNINTNQVPSDNAFGRIGGPASPLFSFNTTTFWINSFNVGFDFEW